MIAQPGKQFDREMIPPSACILVFTIAQQGMVSYRMQAPPVPRQCVRSHGACAASMFPAIRAPGGGLRTGGFVRWTHRRHGNGPRWRAAHLPPCVPASGWRSRAPPDERSSACRADRSAEPDAGPISRKDARAFFDHLPGGIGEQHGWRTLRHQYSASSVAPVSASPVTDDRNGSEGAFGLQPGQVVDHCLPDRVHRAAVERIIEIERRRVPALPGGMRDQARDPLQGGPATVTASGALTAEISNWGSTLAMAAARIGRQAQGNHAARAMGFALMAAAHRDDAAGTDPASTHRPQMPRRLRRRNVPPPSLAGCPVPATTAPARLGRRTAVGWAMPVSRSASASGVSRLAATDHPR